MKTYESTKIGQHRGRPRLWLQGRKASQGGFHPGCRFSVRQDEHRKMLILSLDENGGRVVSRKGEGDAQVPVIDINSAADLAVFQGIDKVRVVVQTMRIIILPAAVELAKLERLERLNARLASKQALRIGSLSHGGGILSHALHAGLKDAGVESELVFANEIRPELLEHAAKHNDAWTSETIALAAPLQELAFDAWAMDHLPKVEMLEAGLPCSGASVSGRARRGTSMAEEHPDVGHLVVPFLAVIAKVQPAIVVLENVKQYLNTASMCILRNHLRDFGYVVHETVLQAADWNVLEHRERMCMVAVTMGLEFNFDLIERPERLTRRLGEILDEVGLDDERWSMMSGLKAKQERDKEKGNSFAMQIVNEQSTSCPTITKGYAKIRSTDPKLRHPSNPDLLRQFSVKEHARIKGVPERMVEGMTQTMGHELLGQSICYAPFKAVGVLLGETLNSPIPLTLPRPAQHTEQQEPQTEQLELMT